MANDVQNPNDENSDQNADDRDAIRTVMDIDYTEAMIAVMDHKIVDNLEEILFLSGKTVNEFFQDVFELRERSQRAKVVDGIGVCVRLLRRLVEIEEKKQGE